MDALKKAELAKRQGNNADADPLGLPGLALEPVIPASPLNLDVTPLSAGAVGLEPIAQTEPSSIPNTEWSLPDPTSTALSIGSSLNDNASEMTNRATDPLRINSPNDLKTTQSKNTVKQAPQDKQAHAAAITEDRKRAENLFQAKQAEPKEKGKRVFAIALGATTLLSLVAIGGYFWWQLQPRTGLGFVAQGVTRPATPPTTPPPVTPAAAPTQSSNNISTGLAASVAPPASGTINLPPAIQQQNQVPSLLVKAARRDEEEDDSPVRITKTPLRPNPSLTKAFEAASRGDSATAQRAYAGVLATEPQNSDAIQGMATLAMREGRLADAERFFQQALVANPQDPTAIAGLANIYARTNPVQAESRLKALASAQPEHAAAHIALGNLFLSQQRWQEAQQAYFTAYTTQPENPDLLFNLAISLEHLNQPRLAVQYYREALSAAKRGTATFKPAQAEDRLRVLQP